MSNNYHLYVAKMASARAARASATPLRRQLIELLHFVLECEAAWTT